MSRWVWFWVCATVGLVLVACGWLVPAHLRAVDATVLQLAGRNTPALVQQWLALVRQHNLGAAQLLLLAAREEALPDRGELGVAVLDLATKHPELQVWGSAEPRLESLFGVPSTTPGQPAARVAPPGKPEETSTPGHPLSNEAGSARVELPFTEFAIRQENRAKLLEFLRASSNPGVQALLRCRALTNTAIFSPAQSASGQALDAALSICGLLLQEGHLTTALSNTVFELASEAQVGKSQRLEQMLLDLMSLGQRLNWGQLVVFVGQVEDAETLRLLANLVRKADGQLPLLFSAIQLSGNPAATVKYVMNFSQTGLKDLGTSLRFGAGGVNELAGRNKRLYGNNLRDQVARNALLSTFFSYVLDYCWRTPWVALTIKWLLYLSGGFLLAAALHFARPAVSALERPLEVRGFHLAREVLFALGFLLVVLVLSEPFLAQDSQKVEFPFRLRLPTVGSAVAARITSANSSLMNQLSLLTLLLFFVLQALIYIACLVKLAEIGRQNVLPRIKLRLLENEDHLFDAGLYLGFAGTIISLILVSLGFIKPSLMAAYSSTSFGIIFVSVFKIFHLRPEKRKLLMEVETAHVEPPSARPRHAIPEDGRTPPTFATTP